MDGCSSWLPFLGGGIGEVVSRQAINLSSSSGGGSEVQQKQDLPISSQMEEQLQELYMLVDMEKTGHPQLEVVPSPESSMFHSFSGSTDETSSLNPLSSSNNSYHHPAEVSSQQIQLHAPVTYYGGGGDCHDHHQCYGNLDTILNMDEFKCWKEPHNERAQHKKDGHGGAFVPYTRHLSPKKKPKPGSGGQRAIKAALAALARMHMVRLAQWQRYKYQMELALAAAPAAAAAPTAGSNGNQQQHVLMERKRREKLNDSFKALGTVLPTASKKDKASILIRARDYVTTLESRVSELEEKKRMLLVGLQHRRNNGVDRGHLSGEKVNKADIDIGREACAVVNETSQEFHLKIAAGSECNAMDSVVSILECLKEVGEVRLVTMDTGSKAITLTLQMKSSRWDDNILKEKVTRSVRDAVKSKIEIN